MSAFSQNKLELEKMDEWYTDHFEELVGKYGGKVIAVVEGEIIAVTDTEKEAEEMALRSKPDAIPLVLAIPTEEELLCLL
jgi:GH35 family endo-1,4-beta-xylanase